MLQDNIQQWEGGDDPCAGKDGIVCEKGFGYYCMKCFQWGRGAHQKDKCSAAPGKGSEGGKPTGAKKGKTW